MVTPEVVAELAWLYAACVKAAFEAIKLYAVLTEVCCDVPSGNTIPPEVV